MAWPNPADYQEAIQHPQSCFSDPELRWGTPLTDQWGLPRPVSGAFATVYRVDWQGHKHAVRCFLRYFPDIEKRYSLISEYLQKVRLPFMVEFKYLSQGIRVRGQWYPILKMDWIEGDRLDTYIGKNLHNSQALFDLALKFLKLTHDLKRASIAHGDLQHGNILVVNGELKLIDYDGMYVPGLSGYKSNELGQPNYQHPRRSEKDFGLYLDHFSEWVIYLTLVALAVDPGLRKRFAPGNEYLLITHDDYVHPNASKLFKTLESERDGTVGAMAARLTSFLYASELVQIPSLDPRLVPTRESVLAAARMPNWVADYVPSPNAPRPALAPSPSAPSPAPSTSPGAAWVHDYLPVSPPASLTGSRAFERALLLVDGFCLVLFAFMLVLGVAELEAASLVGLFSCLTLIGLTLRFNLMPEVREKNVLLAQVRNLQVEIAWGERRLGNLSESVSRLELEEKESLDQLANRRRDSVQREIDEAKAVRKKLEVKLTQINARRQQLVHFEGEEKKRALEAIQNRALSIKLSEYPLSSANLPGLSSQVLQILREHAVFTAADVANIQVLPTAPGSSFSSAYVQVPGRGLVKLEGISASKAQVLLVWRRGLERRLSRDLPQSLPLTQQTLIQVKYSFQRRFLESREKSAKQDASESEHGVHVRREQEREMLSARLQSVPGQFNSARKQLFQEIAEKKKQVSDKKWERARLERELEPYCGLTFSAYLRRLF